MAPDSDQPDPRGDFGEQAVEASGVGDHDEGLDSAASGEFASGHHEPVEEAAPTGPAADDKRRDREPRRPPRAEGH
jgi:hypothetical protein